MSICKLKMLENVEKEMIDIKSNTKIVEKMDARKAIEKHGYIMDYRFRGPCVKLVKREIVLAHPFPVGRKYGEDAACVYLWMWDCKTIVEVDEVYYYYFQHKDSCTHEEYNGIRLDNFLTYEELLDFYNKVNIPDLYVFTLQKYICEMCSGYEISKLYNKTDLTNIIRGKIEEVMRNRIHIDSFQTVECREDIIRLYKKYQMKGFFIII